MVRAETVRTLVVFDRSGFAVGLTMLLVGGLLCLKNNVWGRVIGALGASILDAYHKEEARTRAPDGGAAAGVGPADVAGSDEARDRVRGEARRSLMVRSETARTLVVFDRSGYAIGLALLLVGGLLCLQNNVWGRVIGALGASILDAAHKEEARKRTVAGRAGPTSVEGFDEARNPMFGWSGMPRNGHAETGADRTRGGASVAESRLGLTGPPPFPRAAPTIEDVALLARAATLPEPGRFLAAAAERHRARTSRPANVDVRRFSPSWRRPESRGRPGVAPGAPGSPGAPQRPPWQPLESGRVGGLGGRGVRSGPWRPPTRKIPPTTAGRRRPLCTVVGSVHASTGTKHFVRTPPKAGRRDVRPGARGQDVVSTGCVDKVRGMTTIPSRPRSAPPNSGRSRRSERRRPRSVRARRRYGERATN